jgi:sialidase-1
MLVAMFVALPAAVPAANDFTAIYRAGDLGYGCFMNPSAIAVGKAVWAFAEARWPSCGDFDCRWDNETQSSICGKHDIALRRSLDSGRTWTPIELVVRVDRDFGPESSVNASIFNVSPVYDHRTSAIVLMFNLQPAAYNNVADVHDPHARETYTIISTDQGATFSRPRNITSQLQASVTNPWAASRNPMAVTPGPGIQLRSGALLMPGYGCPQPASGVCVGYGLNSSLRTWSYRSDDGGVSWSMSTPSPAVGAGEAMAVELSDGRLLMNARSIQWPHDGQPHPQRHRLYLTSTDGGRSWSGDAALGEFGWLTGPSCEAAFVRERANGRDLLLFSNPASNLRRVNMTLRVSRDSARSWTDHVVYPNSSWYSTIVMVDSAVSPGSAGAVGPRVGRDAPSRDALLLFTKDCDSPIANDHGECKSISMWRMGLDSNPR